MQEMKAFLQRYAYMQFAAVPKLATVPELLLAIGQNGARKLLQKLIAYSLFIGNIDRSSKWTVL